MQINVNRWTKMQLIVLLKQCFNLNKCGFPLSAIYPGVCRLNFLKSRKCRHFSHDAAFWRQMMAYKGTNRLSEDPAATQTTLDDQDLSIFFLGDENCDVPSWLSVKRKGVLFFMFYFLGMHSIVELYLNLISLSENRPKKKKKPS